VRVVLVKQDGTGTIVDNDLDDDGLCDAEDTLSGCTDIIACNYDSLPTLNTDNTTCEYSTDLDACASCSGQQDGTGTIVDNDLDDDGLCDAEDTLSGCTDIIACNYDSLPTLNTDNTTCEYSTDLDACASCSGQQDGTGTIVDNDLDDDGLCDAEDTLSGCTDIIACNYDSLPTLNTDNTTCEYSTDLDACASCSGQQDGTGTIVDNDLDDDGLCDAEDTLSGCTDIIACNYDSLPTLNTDNTTCEYSTDLDACASCSGQQDGTGTIVDNDLDDDGLCDAEDTLSGCTDIIACNYDSLPTLNTDNTTCEYSTDLDACASCSGQQDGTGTIVDNDLDDDGLCDAEDTLSGCTDIIACNYDSLPTLNTDNTTCEYSTDLDACASCSGEQDGTGTIVDNDLDDDGLCDAEDTLSGCTDIIACNYDSLPTLNTDDNSCTYAVSNADCDGNCLLGYTDVNGTCVPVVEGCMDATACNYDEPTGDVQKDVNTDDGSCITKKLYYLDYDQDGFVTGKGIPLCPEDIDNNRYYVLHTNSLIEDPCPYNGLFTGLHNSKLYDCDWNFKDVLFSKNEIEQGRVNNNNPFKTVFAYNYTDRTVFDETEAKRALENYDGGTVSDILMKSDSRWGKKWLPPTEDQLKVIHKEVRLPNGEYWILEGEKYTIINIFSEFQVYFNSIFYDPIATKAMLIYTFEIKPTFF
jgi:hypothetical protein